MRGRTLSSLLSGLALSSLLGVPALADKPAPPAAPVAPAAPVSLPFGPGERFEYDLVTLGATAGRLKLGVVDEGEHDGKSLMSLAAKLSPSPIIAALWQGESRRTSFLDTAALAPVRVIDVEESPGKLYKTQLDFGATQVSTTRFGIRPDGSDALSRRTIPAGTLETLTGLYQLRARSLAVGDQFQMSVLDNGTLYVLSCKVARSEEIKTVLGAEEALVIEVEARRPVKAVRPAPKAKPVGKVAQAGGEGIALASTGPIPAAAAEASPAPAAVEAPKPADITAKIWLSTSPDRVPLRFEVSIHKMGSMTAELSNYTPAP